MKKYFLLITLIVILIGVGAVNAYVIYNAPQKEKSSIEITSSHTPIPAEPEPEEASISITKQDTWPRSSSNALNIYGITSDNCSKVEVGAINSSAGISDKYTLNDYKKGDTTFHYGAREDWDNLGAGSNKYTFTAYCDGGQEVQDQLSIIVPAVQPKVINSANSYNNPLPNYDYLPPTYISYPLSSDNAIESQIEGEFDGWDGETIFKLTNGQIWQQSSYDYHYHYAYRPEVIIYKVSSGYKLKVEDVDETISVKRIN